MSQPPGSSWKTSFRDTPGKWLPTQLLTHSSQAPENSDCGPHLSLYSFTFQATDTSTSSKGMSPPTFLSSHPPLSRGNGTGLAYSPHQVTWGSKPHWREIHGNALQTLKPSTNASDLTILPTDHTGSQRLQAVLKDGQAEGMGQPTRAENSCSFPLPLGPKMSGVKDNTTTPPPPPPPHTCTRKERWGANKPSQVQVMWKNLSLSLYPMHSFLAHCHSDSLKSYHNHQARHKSPTEKNHRAGAKPPGI